MNDSWVNGASALERGGRETLVAIGNFDGVHRGHQEVLARSIERAEAEGLLPVVLTFRPHPAEVLGRSAPAVLTPLPRKVELLLSHAPGLRVVVERFDTEFAAQEPEQFARAYLRGALGARWVVVGQNFRFGRARAGDFAALCSLGQSLGFAVSPTPLVGDERGRWSSTRVRSSLVSGDLDDVTHVLGRPHELSGVVVEGHRRGRTIGFPTANLGSIEEAIPAYGVYAVEVDRLDPSGGPPSRLANGVANIGKRPTLAAGFAAEAHLFDFTGDLYGQRLRLRLVKRLREEKAFASLDELKAQIAADAQMARELLSASPSVVDSGRTSE